MYAYPVYVGGGGGYGYGSPYMDSYYGQQDPYAGQQQQPPAQPSMTVVYPPQQTTIINQYPSGDGSMPVSGLQQIPPPGMYGPPPPPRRQAAPVEEEASAPENPHYLIAFKDHTIYSAMAYWVDGDTLHYFTNGSTHNQASLSLVDRELTARLNREVGVEMKLPPVQAAAAAK